MNNVSNTLLKGLLGVLTLVLSNEQLQNVHDTNKMLLVGVMSVLALVFSSDQIISTVQDVNTRKYLVNEGLLANSILDENTLKLIQSPFLQQNVQTPLSQLTPRETDVLGFMAEGLMNKEIANKLLISEATVKNHVTSILRKLNATVRTEAVVIAIKNGFINVKNTFDFHSASDSI